MKPKIRVRRRITSGDIRDPELEAQRIKDIEQKREAVQTITWVLAGAVAFVAFAIIMALAN